jgi:hypothetical protein
MACAYQSADGEADPDKTEALRAHLKEMQKAKVLNARCGICGSRDLHYEDNATQYATMEEARAPLAESAAQQMVTRNFIRQSRN